LRVFFYDEQHTVDPIQDLRPGAHIPVNVSDSKVIEYIYEGDFGYKFEQQQQDTGPTLMASLKVFL